MQTFAPFCLKNFQCSFLTFTPAPIRVILVDNIVTYETRGVYKCTCTCTNPVYTGMCIDIEGRLKVIHCCITITHVHVYVLT